MPDTAEQREQKRLAFLQQHNDQAVKARWTIDDLERAHAMQENVEPIQAGLRILIDMNLRRYPAHDLARRFISLCVLMPQELRVPFINAVARYSRPSGMDDDFKEWAKFKASLQKCGNKLAALVFELDVEFTLWRPRDPAQGDLFDQPQADLLATPIPSLVEKVLDDGGVEVNPRTGEVQE